MSRLNRDESLEVFTLLVRANTQVISTALSLSRIGMKNDAQFSALQKQLRGTEGDVRQAALLSFSYNLGPARICNSQIAPLLNAGKDAQACELMKAYVRANGRVLQGLVNRRDDPVWGEEAWCMRND